ncbi:FadR family transcriptional regulator [Candidimonas humi]|jgi:DNA-binding FadR family transcriptional regulator|uniref:FadR/GntR family transcriptional regulator n=1 Tax=Candidimonas humi TaxID=683355 RepID=A0ABV8P5J5_9BURK|nr:FadR/GntR family transcriptional regulator [Candidimonas humi]MBV6306124.1 FadR family transcriptional regulator [Candidimonas humi]
MKPPTVSAANISAVPVTHGKLADKLYENMLSWITFGDLKEGDRLPSEERLAKQFGVSRPVVRQALLRLRSDEIIISRHGSGSYILRRPKKEFFDFAPMGGVADLVRCFEYRIALEGEAAWLAARRRTNIDLKRIGDALHDMDNAVASRTIATSSDIDFHAAIAAATKNELFVSTMASLSTLIFSGMTVARKLSLQMNLARLELVQKEHLAIYKAIETQDQVAARELMRKHIDNARNRVLTDSVEPDPDTKS